MTKAFPIKSPVLWIATVVGCVGAAYLVARADAPVERDDPNPTADAASPERPSPGLRPVERPTRPGKEADWKTDRSPPPGAWIRIPKSWMAHCRHGVKSEKLHRALGMDHADGQRLQNAATEAMKTGKNQQIATIDDNVMTEGRTLRIPALSDGEIRGLVNGVLSVLPEKAGPADHDLLGFLIERELREDYAHELEVTLKFTQGISTSDLRHLPNHLLGFHYVVRRTDGGGKHPTMSHSVKGGHFEFLKLDPSVTNEGRHPLGR